MPVFGRSPGGVLKERFRLPSRSWRARSGFASVSVGRPVARAFPDHSCERGLGGPFACPIGSASVCLALRRIRRPFAPPGSHRQSRSFPSPRLLLSCESVRSAPVRSGTRLVVASFRRTGPLLFQATFCPSRPFLGRPSFALPWLPLRAARPAAARRSSLPAPLAGVSLRRSSARPATASWGSLCLRKRIPLRRLAGGDRVPRSFLPQALAGPWRRGPLPPDHQKKMTFFASRSKHIRQAHACG